MDVVSYKILIDIDFDRGNVTCKENGTIDPEF